MQSSDNAAVRVQILAAAANAAFAEKVARALEAEGYEISDGDFEPKEIDAAVIIWSGASIASADMIKAAALPLACQALIPVSIGRIEAPPAFRHLQAVDLAGWAGAAQDPRWRFVIDEIDRIAYAARMPEAPAPNPPPARAPFRAALQKVRIPPQALLLASFGLMGALVLGGFFVLTSTRPAPDKAAPTVMAAADDAPLEKAQANALLAATENAAEARRKALAASEEGAQAEADTDETPLQAEAASPRADEVAAPSLAPGVGVDKLAALIAESVEPPAEPAAAPPETEKLETLTAPPPGETFRDCALCPEMAVAPAGRFSFGSPASEPSRESVEGPVAIVEIKNAFAIGAREVTFAEWDACVAEGGCNAEAAHDAGWGRAKRPVINVSWNDAQSYLGWLSAKTGARYRLPTEAEWEYAARAGADTAFSFGALIKPSQANFDASHPYGGEAGEARGRTAPAGNYAKNAFGLYDMHGNVWEWVADCWTENHAGAPADPCKRRVLKGGAWNSGGWRLRAAHRIAKDAARREFDNGFRVVRDLATE